MIRSKNALRREQKKGEQFLSPINIPESKCGAWTVTRTTHPANATFDLANMRCRILGGQPNRKISWPFETTRHALKEDGNVWMTDLPCEIAQMRTALSGLRGRVLVGGLGLGVAVAILARRKSVRKIVIVEKSQKEI